MSEPISLLKANPLQPAEDYTALRKQGFSSIEKLASAVWTDYNNSDPGITILEALCYAITDLAYRTGFEVKDILAPEELTDDTWNQIFYTARQILHNSPLTIDDYRKLIIDVKGVRNAWIEPSKDYEVPIWVDYNFWELRKQQDCSTGGVTERICRGKLKLNPANHDQAKAEHEKTIAKIASFKRKLQERIKPLRNKLISLKEPDTKEADQTEQLLLLLAAEEHQKNIDALTTEIAKLDSIIEESANQPFRASKILELEGFYNVMVEYEEDVLDEHQREAVRQIIIEKLSRHRNLCEDFLSINAVEYEDIGLGTSIEIEEDADPDVVLAEIFFVIYKYFTPSIPFYTIDQLLEKGYQVDDIFEGPPLRHGFIDPQELEKTAFYRDIRLSDIMNEISDIKGIKGILYLHIPFDGLDKNANFYFDAWSKALRNERKIARIQPLMSQVVLCKNRQLITWFTGRAEDRRPERMLKLFRDKKTLERKYKLEDPAVDFPVPAGECMQLEDYYPVTQSLPMCYGVSERVGLPDDSHRKAEVLQLKGYLLFFEQILSDYLVQLNHVKELFTFDGSVKHTSFSRVLEEIDQLQALLIDHDNQGSKNFDHVRKQFAHTLRNLTETPEIFGVRRNLFLDHMLARFSEEMGEYERLSGTLTPDNGADARLIKEKSRILADGEYYSISSNRGRGYDYTQQEFWNSANVSGTERRVSRLLGFSDIKRRTFSPDFLVCETVMVVDPKTKKPVLKKNAKGQILNTVKLFDPDDKSRILLTSVEAAEGCCTEKLMAAILGYADDRKNFRLKEHLKQRSRKVAGLLGTFWFELWDGADPETAVLLATSERYDKKEVRDKAFHSLLSVMEAIDRNEGFHLVEHILLRPRFYEMFDEADKPIPVTFPDICLDLCDLGKGVDEGTEVPPYRKSVHRIPAERCYDRMPWTLDYFRYNAETKLFDQSILFQKVDAKSGEQKRLKFRRYENLAQRVRDLHEFGSERINYKIVSNLEDDPAKRKYGFIIHGNRNIVLAESRLIFSKKRPAETDDIEREIETLMRYFAFELDLYCEANSCDNNEDPYSFRATAVLPCWPKRFRDPTFRALVEKTIQSESPAHTHIRTVWLGILEMQRFEKAYLEWLLEMSQTEMPSIEKTNPLVDVLNTLRPCGLCEEECN
ncbi:MAG: hypothetical protein HGB23_06410 [Chlorobiaceae bacterium]|nr:hypothetical protein [Chlorobiaceae bacterium]